MNILLGIIILFGVTMLALHYHPRKREGLSLCGVAVLQACTIFLGGSGSPLYLLIQFFFASIVMACCAVALRREKQKAASRACRRAQTLQAASFNPSAEAQHRPMCVKSKFCA